MIIFYKTLLKLMLLMIKICLKNKQKILKIINYFFDLILNNNLIIE